MNNNLNAPVELFTARLLLRKPKLDDAGRLFRAYASDNDTVRFMSWRAHKAEDETLGFLRDCLGKWSNGTAYPYAVEIAGEPAGPVGMIGLHNHPGMVLFGYVIARPYRGQGYMTEALSVLVDWSLDQPHIWRASAFCDVENLASARVMEKSGMAFEGILRRNCVHPNISSKPRSCRMYAKVRA